MTRMNLILNQGAVSPCGAPYAVVDAAIADRMQGNPAAVVRLDNELPTSILLRLAQELDEPVTAIVTERAGSRSYNIRWFTRNGELRICGHATLAASEWILAGAEVGHSVEWHSKAGVLTANRKGGKITVDFPETKLHRMDPLTIGNLATALGTWPKECFLAGDDYLAVLDSAAAVVDFEPTMDTIEILACRGVILSAECHGRQDGKQAEDRYDFVSRFFAPRIAIPEDEVCVSAHCALHPFWAEKFGRQRLMAWQASPRGGALELVSHQRGRISITGVCRVSASGTWNVKGSST